MSRLPIRDLDDEQRAAIAAQVGIRLAVHHGSNRCMDKSGCTGIAAVELYTGSGRLMALLCDRHADGQVLAAYGYRERAARRADGRSRGPDRRHRNRGHQDGDGDVWSAPATARED